MRPLETGAMVLGKTWAGPLLWCLIVCHGLPVCGGSLLDDGKWATMAPRDEVKPQFRTEAKGGRDGRGAWVISTDRRPGQIGAWVQTVSVEGGRTYAFQAFRKATGVALPRRSVYVRIMWLDENRKTAVRDQPVVGPYHRQGAPDLSAGEYPPDLPGSDDEWVELAGVYRAPLAARFALIELHLDWTALAEVRYSDMSFGETQPPAPRPVRLGTVHYIPSGRGSAADNCREFAPLIAEAARQKADLVVLPETLTHTGRGVTYAEAGESIPGPSTEYFGTLAREHGVHLVVGLLEREETAVYNVAVLIDDRGVVLGKYRKVCLPRTEVEMGLVPGDSYPVFETRFGKVGMMVCYDGFFPEVARELTNNGAEIIAFPVAGCNPLLAAARACENHVYVVSSTYTDASRHWMISGIFGHQGDVLAQAREWGTVAVVEVDLRPPTVWAGIGDFRAQLFRHRPAGADERRGREQRQQNLLPARAETRAQGMGAPVADEGRLPSLRVSPREPAEAATTFTLKEGFQLRLLAAEPLVTDPIAMEYDESGRAFVIEMNDYPHTDPQTDKPFTSKMGDLPIGRIRVLEDLDGDGRFDRGTVFAEGLSWPTGLALWRGGIYVAATPDLWYLRDTDGDGRADEKRRVFSGFSKFNIQAVMNNLRWGLDHRIYCAGGTNGGMIESGNATGMPPRKMTAHDFRFDPGHEQLELLSGGTRFGQTFDDWGNRFTCNIRNPIRHSVIEDRYLSRNPHVTTVPALHDVTESGDTVPVFRASQPEPWRVLNARRLATDPTSTSPRSESTAAGYMTSACGITIYRGDAYPAEYYGTVFLGEVAANLVHRQRLEPVSLTFRAGRIDPRGEFLVSTDNWFRPVNFVNAPDGSLHLLDMYRETIEHPWSIPEDLKARLDLQSGRDRGRIYRLESPGFQPSSNPRLERADTAGLVRALVGLNSWRRETAHRLIFEQQDPAAVPPLRELLHSRAAEEPGRPAPVQALGRLHALWSLEGLNALSSDDLVQALDDPAEGVREQAVLLAEPRLAADAAVREAVLARVQDSSIRVRSRVALALGGLVDSRSADAVASIVMQSPDDVWIRAVALCLDPGLAHLTLNSLVQRIDGTRETQSPVTDSLLPSTVQSLALTVGARQVPAELKKCLETVSVSGGDEANPAPWLRRAVVLGLAEGLSRQRRPIRQVVAEVTPQATGWVEGILAETQRLVVDPAVSPIERIQALSLLEWSDRVDLNSLVEPLLAAREPQAVQLAAVKLMARRGEAGTPQVLLGAWATLTPQVRGEVVHALLGRAEWIPKLLEGLERDVLVVSDIPIARRGLLLKSAVVEIRERAEKLFQRSAPAERVAVIAKYQPALELTGNRTRGLEVCRRVCQVCHQFGGEGQAVGPALESVKHRGADELLLHILDPNREVQPAFWEYTARLRDGRSTSGIVTDETPNTITFLRAQGVVETVLRDEIEELVNTRRSLMPEGLESQISPAQMADLLACLQEGR